MTKQQINKMIENTNWTELHEWLYTCDSGVQVLLWEDGSITTLSQNERFIEQPDEQYVIFKSWGRDVDSTVYGDGWTTKMADGNYKVDEDGRILNLDEMIIECIRTGDFIDEVEGWKDIIRQNAGQKSYE